MNVVDIIHVQKFLKSVRHYDKASDTIKAMEFFASYGTNGFSRRCLICGVI